MTSSSKFLIGPINDALRKDVKPFATPEDSFTTLTNAYQFRGRVVRRGGYTLLARLSTDGGTTFPGNPVMGLRTRELFGIGLQQLIAFDTTTAYLFSGTTFTNLVSTMPVTWNGQNFQFFWSTNYAGGFWVTNDVPGLNGYALNTSVAAFTGAVGSTVMVNAPGNTFMVGDQIYFTNINTGSAAFSDNLRFGTVTVAGNPFTFQATDGNPPANMVNGSVTTGIAMSSTRQTLGQDGIRYYTGTTWVNYNPPLDTQNVLAGAQFIFPYRGYLVFLGTNEGNDLGVFYYGNRARWTQIGTPYYSDPVPLVPSPQTFDFNTARDDLFGRGGANDAPTSEVIVTAGFIRDILVVYFERSTWRLRFVNNSQNPFVWERVNVEFGSDCPFSAIAFDKGLMAIGNRGITISDGNDTVRFDEKIPDDIFDIRQANDGLQRVFGIRTFESRLLYWTYPSDENESGIFPDKVLVFNYDTKNWSYFDDCFTCFGYLYNSGSVGPTWNSLTETWSSYGQLAWNSGSLESGDEQVIAGNQQGFVLILNQTNGPNSPSLFITALTGDIVTSPNNNLKDGDWITLSGVTGITYSDGVSLNGRNFKVANPSLDPNNFTLTEFKPILNAPNASGSIYDTYTIGYTPIVPGSVQINVGALEFTDFNSDGILHSTGSNNGTIDYNTGVLVLNFSPPIASTSVSIRVVSYSSQQPIGPIATTGAYSGGGLIAKISNFDLQTKFFNFFKDDKRARLSKIDFYVSQTPVGQFTCNVFSDSSNTICNTPLPDNPQSNIVLTSPNPNQFGAGTETIFRLYSNVVAQTLQFQLTMADQQIAVTPINSCNFELNAMIVSMNKGGRLV